jgi:Na+/phosphate symporter
MIEITAMTLIEAMKGLKHTERKIDSNKEKIQKYSATLDNERLPFETEENQGKEVQSLLQSCEDLDAYRRKLKECVEYTNLMTKVEIQGATYSISELLFILRKTADSMLSVYKCLNIDSARGRLRGFVVDAGKQIPIKAHYKETDKNEKLKKWQELKDTIESRLEVINATTQLLKIPE